MIALLIAGALAGAIPAERELTAPGPQGSLAASLIDAGKGAPVVVILPGSGPTDRDGNNPLGVKAQPYKLLAEALAGRGISTVRIDKRGMFGSKAAVADANRVTIADYAADAHVWARAARAATGAKCVWLLGHSEGGLVALKAGQDRTDLCGIITVSAMGRKFGPVLAEQLKANPANAPFLAHALFAIAELEAGRSVPLDKLPPPLPMLFAPSVQPYLIDLMRQDSAALAGELRLPLLIVQGDKDLQVGMGDAHALLQAQKKAKLVILPDVNHVLKRIEGADRSANLRSYGDPDVPIAPSLVRALSEYLKP